MAWLGKLKEYLFHRKYCGRDAILLLAVLALGGVVYLSWTFGFFAIQKEYPVSQGYQVRYRDGWAYVLDSGHSTLTKASSDGNMVYRVSPGYYIDGFSLGTDGSVVCNASSFSGMTIVGEKVLRYDSQGKNMQVIAENDYGDGFLNKHSLHGTTEQDGVVRYVECLENEIVVHSVELSDLSRREERYAYHNAFNAVSDAGFNADTLYVLNRNGTVHSIAPNGKQETLYSVEESGEYGRVPYRLTVTDEGEVYFTDIRSLSVQHIVKGAMCSETVVQQTSSVTVDVSRGADGTEQYILASGGTVELPDGTLSAFRSQIGAVVLSYVVRVLLGIAALLVLILAIRALNVAVRGVRTVIQRVTLVLSLLELLTVLLVGGLLTNSFRTVYTDKVNEELMNTAITTANIIDPNDVLSIREAKDYDTDAYRRINAAMEKVFDRSVEFNRYAYCNILRYDGEGSGYCIAYLDGSIGTYYPLDPYETAETIEVYNTHAPVVSDIIEDISGIYLGVKVPILDAAGDCVGVVSAGTQVVLLNALLSSMMLRILAAVLIFGILIWFFASEAIAFVRNIGFYQTEHKERSNVLPGHLLRLLLVLIFAAYNLEASFLPSYIIHQLPDESNAELLASLPYTVNIFIVGLTALFCARLVQRAGIRMSLLVSMALAGAGNLLIFAVSGYAAILLGMALIGLGVGVVTNAMYVLLTYVEDDADQIWGLSIYNAAVMAGINLGMVGGSVLAVFVGRRLVFAICAALWVVILLMSGSIMKSISGAVIIPQPTEQTEEQHSSLRAFLCNRVVPAYMICIQNPYIVFSSIAMYYLPIFCDAQGYRETAASLLLLCYAEISIFMGDSMVKWANKKLGRAAMYVALGINIAALLVFAATGNLLGMMITLLLLGISASFGKPVQQKYFIDLPQVKAYGEDRAMGVYNFTENIGESAGPIVIGWLLSRAPMMPAVAGFCGLVAALAGVHSVVSRNNTMKNS